MKKLFKLMSVLLVFAMLFSLAACATDKDPKDTSVGTGDTGNTTNPGDTNKYADIAGEYFLDGTDFGMAMKWYIRITADGKFQISNAREFTEESDKGNGTIGDKDGTYMFLYSDSTNEKPKTATFKLDGKNLAFEGPIPIGGATLASDDENNKPTAKLIAHEDILGSYFGELNKTTGMGAVLYTYELTLKAGMEYDFVSSFEMMGSPFSRKEAGTFDVKDGKISFTAKEVDGKPVEAPVAVEGTIADKKINASFKLSMMAKDPDAVEINFGTHSDWAGEYVAYYEKAMGSMTLSYKAVLTLDPFGAYKYATYSATAPDQADYSEEGTYTVDGSKFTFKSKADGAAAVEGKLENFVLSAKFKITSMVPNAVDLAFYTEAVSGDFYAKAENGGKTYVATLSMVGNEFSLSVGPKDDKGENTTNYVVVGTFEIKGGMMTQITFTASKLYKDIEMENEVATIIPELKSFTFPVADTGINGLLVFDLEDTATVVFQFTHDISVTQF